MYYRVTFEYTSPIRAFVVLEEESEEKAVSKVKEVMENHELTILEVTAMSEEDLSDQFIPEERTVN